MEAGQPARTHFGCVILLAGERKAKEDRQECPLRDNNLTNGSLDTHHVTSLTGSLLNSRKEKKEEKQKKVISRTLAPLKREGVSIKGGALARFTAVPLPPAGKKEEEVRIH